MTENDYIRTTHIARLYIIKQIMQEEILEESESIPLNVSGITADERKEVIQILCRATERLQKAIKVK